MRSAESAIYIIVTSGPSTTRCIPVAQEAIAVSAHAAANSGADGSAAS